MQPKKSHQTARNTLFQLSYDHMTHIHPSIEGMFRHLTQIATFNNSIFSIIIRVNESM